MPVVPVYLKGRWGRPASVMLPLCSVANWNTECSAAEHCRGRFYFFCYLSHYLCTKNKDERRGYPMDVKHEEIPLLQRKVANVRKATKCCSLSVFGLLPIGKERTKEDDS